MSEAIQTVISEFKTLSPEVASAAVFRASGQTLASTENTPPEQTQTILDTLNSLTHAQCIGGVKNLTIQDVSAQLSVTTVGDVYLSALTRRTGNDKAVKSLTRVVGPTVICLALGITDPTQTAQVEAEEPKAEVPSIPEALVEFAVKAKALSEQFQPKATPNQLMVEKLGGLLVASDTVRVDGELFEKWQDTCGKSFSHVKVETLEGETVTCKVKPIKEGKSNSRGVVLVPEKLIQALQTQKGKLVMVKPIPEEAQ